METHFAHTYLLLFGKLAVGGLIALAVPTFTDLERGFYKSTAAVYLGAALIMLCGDVYLFAQARNSQAVGAFEIFAWALHVSLFAAYFVTLYTELAFVRARIFPLAIVSGLIAVAASAWSYVPADVTGLAGVFFAVTLAAGALTTGAGMSGMLLGHWYLIDTGLDLAPLLRMHAYCRACLQLEIIAVVAVAAVLWVWPGGPWQDGFSALVSSRFVMLAIFRVAAWCLAGLLLVLIGRTLAIPQTMAATGLFYIQALVVAVGAISAHWILFRTGLPL